MVIGDGVVTVDNSVPRENQNHNIEANFAENNELLPCTAQRYRLMNLVSLSRYWGSRNPLKTFRVNKVTGKGKFQDGGQNGFRALSASLSR